MLFTGLNLSPSKTNENRCLLNDWTFVQRFLSFKNFFLYLSRSFSSKKERQKKKKMSGKNKKTSSRNFPFQTQTRATTPTPTTTTTTTTISIVPRSVAPQRRDGSGKKSPKKKQAAADRADRAAAAAERPNVGNLTDAITSPMTLSGTFGKRRLLRLAELLIRQLRRWPT